MIEAFLTETLFILIDICVKLLMNYLKDKRTVYFSLKVYFV